MKKIFVGLFMSMSCLMANYAHSQLVGKTGVKNSNVNVHSEFVVRFSSPQSLLQPSLPIGTTVTSKHEPMNILVVKNERMEDVLFLDLLHNMNGVVRIETAGYDNAGSPVYPTGVVLLDPFNEGDARSNEFCKDKGCTPDRALESLGWFTVLLPAEISYEEFQNQAKASGLFQSVMRDEIILAQNSTSNDPMYSNCWYIYQANDKDIDADMAWDALPGNSIAKNVAVIDGHGFDTTHPDMVGNWADTFNAVDGTTNVMPENAYDKHGTSCAGIPAAEYNNSLGTPGLGKNLLQVQAIKVGYNITSSGSFYTSSTIEASAINRVISNGNSVTISMSFGSTSYQSAFLNAITSARTTGRNGKGIVVFASSGNDGLSAWTNYPASYAGVIAVGATSSSDTRSSFSNYGPGVTLSAPGSGITTIDIVGASGYSTTDYTNFSGTSAACPVAASVGAMMIVANPLLTEAQGQVIMAQSCDKSGSYTYGTDAAHPSSSWCNELGYGRVNMYNAVQQALAAVATPADITITSSAVDDITPTVGQTINISCNQITSSPTGASTSVTLEYRWSTDQTWSTSDALIGTDASTLGGGISSEAETISYIVPSGTGTRYILIKCDAADILTESNESNNIIAIPVTVSSSAILPDITVTSYSVNDNTPTVGQSVTISCQQLIVSASLVPTDVVLEYRYSTDAAWSTSDIVIGMDTSSLGLLLTLSAESINYTIPAGIGTRYILIKADVTNVISESNESNNTYIIPVTVSAAAAPVPDISVTSAAVNNSVPVVGQTLNITCNQVTDVSTMTSSSLNVEYRWSTDQTWSTSDVVIGTDVSTLGGGISSETESITYVVPAGTGTRYILINCDASSALTESNETNNIVVIPVTVSTVVVLPDITISSYSVNDNTANVGQVITISCQQLIANPSLAATNIVMEYRYSTDASWSTGDIVIGTDTSALGLLLSASPESVSFTIPAGTGTRFILIKADVTNALSESSETNNNYIIPVTVSAAAAPVPDVTITSLAASAGAATVGQNVTVTCNQAIANAPATAVTVEIAYRWSTDQVWSADDATLGTSSSTLGGGITSEGESLNFAVPAGTGTRYLLVMSDAAGAIAESNESNVYTLTFTITAATSLPDVFLDEVTVTSTNVTVGQSITVATFQNISNPAVTGVNVFMEYRWATGTTWSTSYPIIGIDYSSLGAGDADDDESLVFTVPAGSGQRYILIKCDSNNGIAESDEANNVYVIPMMVSTTTANTVQSNGSDEVQGSSNSIVEEDLDQEDAGTDILQQIEAEEENIFSVYPNPVRESLNINFEKATEQAGSYEIRSMTGALVARDIIGTDTMIRTVDTSQLDGGIYFVSVSFNGKSTVQKIIVTH